MKKPILFKRTRESVAKKLSNHIYIDIINSHDTKLELIYIERILKKIDSMSEEEIQELINREWSYKFTSYMYPNENINSKHHVPKSTNNNQTKKIKSLYEA